MQTFSITERPAEPVIILDIKGRIIFGEGSTALNKSLRQLVNRGEKYILLNFSDVSHIDSSGLGELIGGFVAAKRIDGEIKLCNLPSNVLELMKLTKLNEVFEIYTNEAEAAQNFGSQTSTFTSISQAK